MIKLSFKNIFYKTNYFLVLIALIWCFGCSQPRRELFEPLEVPLVWPGSPDPNRVEYIGQISTEADLKVEVPFHEGLTELIFGKKEIGAMVGPYAIAVDEAKRMFVVDSASSTIHMFDLLNRKYNQFFSLGNDEVLEMPVAIVLIDNNIYIVDSMLHRVCVFNSEGKFGFSFGSDELKRPSGIAYCPIENRIYVSDAAEHTVNIFNMGGELVKTIGSRGSNTGEFNFPTHLWIDKQGRLYVSDTLNYRIQVFACDGKFLRTFGEHGDRPGYFAHPSGIATDSFGHIYVADRQFENIQIFSNEGQILMALGYEGSNPGEFWLPAGMYIDKQNVMYIADSFNSRVQIFQLLGATKDGN
jgi:DNA-binding beta-propeller fold protein YncE